MFGWQLDKDQLSIVVTGAIAVIILSSITTVFIIWYCCFCRKKIGKLLLYIIVTRRWHFTDRFRFPAQNNDEEDQRSNTNNIPG